MNGIDTVSRVVLSIGLGIIIGSVTFAVVWELTASF